MIRKSIGVFVLMLTAAFLFGCSTQVETVEEPIVAIKTESEIEEVAEQETVDEAAEIQSSENKGAEEEPAEEMAEETTKETEEVEESTYTVSAADSTVSWKGDKPLANSHTGVIDIAEGSLTLAGDALVAGSFVIDMTSITSTDGAPDRLTQHLNSDDFFGTATFPTASLVIKSAESLGGDQYAVIGDLTIKEITNPIEFTATASEADGTVTASADIVFDRALYDVQFGSGTFFSDLGDDLIADDIEITVELVAQK